MNEVWIYLVATILVVATTRLTFLLLTGRETLEGNEKFLFLFVSAFSVVINLVIFVPSVQEQQIANQRLEVSNELAVGFQEKFLLNRAAEDQEFYSDVLQLTIRRSLKAEDNYSLLLAEEISSKSIPLGKACKEELEIVGSYRNLTPFCKLEGLQLDEELSSAVEGSKEILFGREQSPE